MNPVILQVRANDNDVPEHLRLHREIVSAYDVIVTKAVLMHDYDWTTTHHRMRDRTWYKKTKLRGHIPERVLIRNKV